MSFSSAPGEVGTTTSLWETGCLQAGVEISSSGVF